MPNNLEVGLLSWASIYFLHSTLLFCLAWLACRWQRNPAVQELLWKSAFVGGILTATLQIGIREWTPLSTTPPTPTRADTPAPSLNEIPLPSLSTNTTYPITSISLRETHSNLLFIIWGIAVLTGTIRFAWRYHYFYRQMGQRNPLKKGVLYNHLADLCQQISIPVPLLSDISVKMSPILLPNGEICLPAAAEHELSSEAQRGILAHELAHRMRGDHHWRLFAQLLIVLFPFQPLLRGAQRELHRTAEQLSDTYAVTLLGSPIPVVRGLVQVATWLTTDNSRVPVSAMATRSSPLTKRVQRLLHPPAFRPPAKQRWFLGIVLLGVSLVVVTPSVTVAAITGEVKESFSDPLKPLASPTPRATRTPTTNGIAPTPTVLRRPPIVRATPELLPVAVWPVDGHITVQPSTYHMAIDIAGEEGTPIVAAWDGTITATGFDNTGYGYRIIIKHNNGYETLYAHLKTSFVEVGDHVSAGEFIGTRGATGRVTGPSLHFEVRLDGSRMNPWNYLP